MQLYQKIIKEPIQVFRRRWNADGRGKLLEGLRNDDTVFSEDFGQAYVTTIKKNRIKAWHMHAHQTDRMLLILGTVRFVCAIGLAKHTEEGLAPDVLLDFVVSDLDPYLIVIPPTIYHGFQNLGNEEAYILNIPNKVYDYKEPDEQRLDSDAMVHFPWDVSLDG